MGPLVSVIMPVYNQEKYLTETIESVLVQTFQDFEFLILDDGSTDNSAKIIRSYAAKDKRIKSFFRSNAGKCKATNNLVAKAKGGFCAFLDADDVMMPNRLEKQVAFHLSHFEIDASSCHCYYINDQGVYLGQQRYPFLKTADECRQTISDNKIVYSAFTGLMTTRKCFIDSGGLRNDIWPCEDLEFVNRLIEKGYLLVIIQELLMKYRIHSSSITAQKQWHLFDWSSYVCCCIKLRRAGKPEITFEEYMNQSQNASWMVKLELKAHRYSQILHKEAGFAFHSKKYLRFSFLFMGASLLNPRYVFATLRNRMAFPAPVK